MGEEGCGGGERKEGRGGRGRVWGTEGREGVGDGIKNYSICVYAVAARTPAQGAATILNCAVHPELNSNKHYFYTDCRVNTPPRAWCVHMSGCVSLSSSFS